MSELIEIREFDTIDIDLKHVTPVIMEAKAESITVKSTEEVQKFYPNEGEFFNEVVVDSVAIDKPDQTKTTIPTKERQVVRADIGYELAENIVEPIPVEFITTADANATAVDIVKDKTAYVNGNKITGEFEPLDISDTTATAEDVAKGKDFYTADGIKTTGTGNISTGVDRLQWKCDNMKSLYGEFYGFVGTDEEFSMLVNDLDTSPVENYSRIFMSASIKEIPQNFNFENGTDLSYFAYNCQGPTQINISELGKCNKLSNFLGVTGGLPMSLKSVRLSGLKVVSTMENFGRDDSSLYSNLTEIILDGDTSMVTNYKSAFYRLKSVVTIETIDMLSIKSATSASDMFSMNIALENLLLKNIKIRLQIGSGASWGRLLTDDSLINTAKELWDLTGGTSQTLTVSTASNTRFDAIYVKLITATDEMIAEDEYINNKKPCVVCESSDEGAMTLREYVVSKNWALT